MTAALFGATGRTGRLVLDECLGRGWSCRALVRNGAALRPRTGLEIVTGDARSGDEVVLTVEGADAVFCTLGMSDITQPSTDFSDSVKAIVRAMTSRGIRRIVAVASASVLDDPSGGYRALKGTPGPFRNINAEHIRNFETLRDSGLDWTLMCPLSLRDDIPPGRVRHVFEDLPGGSSETGYADLARTMVTLLHDRASYCMRVGIVSER